MTELFCSDPMLAGNVVALLSPLVFVPVLTFAFKPQSYDWSSMKAISKADDSDLAAAAHVDLELIPGGHAHSAADDEAEQAQLKKASKFSRIMTVCMTLALLVLWPMPLYGSGYIFSKKFFTGWVTVGIIWIFFSTACVGVYPLWEGRSTIFRTAKAIYADVFGGGRPLLGRAAAVEGVSAESPSAGSPPAEKVDEVLVENEYSGVDSIVGVEFGYPGVDSNVWWIRLSGVDPNILGWIQISRADPNALGSIRMF
jgi:urea-proton symporter